MQAGALISFSAGALALVASLVSSPAYAANCTKAISQTAMNECSASDFTDADRSLNNTYSQIVGRLATDEPLRRDLTTAQLAWIKFRDAECEFSTALAEGGSVRPMLVAGCKARLTRARTSDLARYLRCHEGDLDCPVPSRP